MSKDKIQVFTASPKVFFVLAAIVLAFFFPPLLNGYLSASWPTVSGRMISADINSFSTSHEIFVTYSYEVNGQEYTGSKFSYNRQDIKSSRKELIYEHLKNYKKGSTVTVYYNPSKPGKSTLVTGYGILDLVLSSMGAIFLLSGISIYFKTRSLNNGINTYE